MELRDSVFNEIYKLMEKDDKIMVLTADHGAFGLKSIQRDFPDRYYNIGISEQNMISVAAGLALDGMRPIVYTIINFTTFRCLEQINIDVSMMNLPIIILGVGAGFCYSTDGPTHHGVQDIGIMKIIPNLNIYNPSNEITCRESLNDAYKYNGPSYIRFDKGNYDVVQKYCDDYGGYRIINPSLIHKKIVISTGTIIHDVISVSEELGCGVIEVYKLKELPHILYLVENITDILVVEEHFSYGGLGTIILEYLNKKQYNNIKVKILGIENNHTFVYGDRKQLLQKHKLDTKNLKEVISEFLQK